MQRKTRTSLEHDHAPMATTNADSHRLAASDAAPHSAAAAAAARADLQAPHEVAVRADVHAPTTTHNDNQGPALVAAPRTTTITHDDYLVSQQHLRMTRVQHLRTQKLESPY
jgi:hypothetical protein